MNKQPSYYAIIPAGVRYHRELKPAAKLLYGELTALCSVEGYCWASNAYFAEIYQATTRQVQRWIADLAKFGFIKVEVDQNQHRSKRRIYMMQMPQADPTQMTYDEKVATTHDEKVVHSITDSSNTSLEDNNKSIVATDKNVIASKPQKSFSQEVEFIAQELYRHVIANYPHLEARCKWRDWCDDIDKLNRIDGYDFQTIMAVMKWSQQDDFWKQNILSGKKLRKQFSHNLLPKIKGSIDKSKLEHMDIDDSADGEVIS